MIKPKKKYNPVDYLVVDGTCTKCVSEISEEECRRHLCMMIDLVEAMIKENQKSLEVARLFGFVC